MGEADHVLRVKIFMNPSKRLLGLSQKAYLKKVLDRFQMHKSRPMDTHVAKGDLSLNDCAKTPKEKEKMMHVPCSSVVGGLIYKTDDMPSFAGKISCTLIRGLTRWQDVTLFKDIMLETRAKLLLRGGHFDSGEELRRTGISIKTVMLGHN
ncbi:hypothetical protein RJ640_000494 [Escallonia rubra]|uniref:Retrovirus-related Pol polyprotein from transposon TNT 1-94 n=1 Tax=Escallonia rubra TaxID=112253 RepID=A0AA88QMN2_9ASTE|nr:hypothetical protein RJ640_000494 [Escallonia rubra]